MISTSSNSILRILLLAFLLNPNFVFAGPGPRGVRRKPQIATRRRGLKSTEDKKGDEGTGEGGGPPSTDKDSKKKSDKKSDKKKSEKSTKEKKHKVKAPSKRKCGTTQKQDEVEFRCQSDTEDSESSINDEIRYRVRSADGELKVKVEYEQEIRDNESETESGTKFEIIFERIIEYRKNKDLEISVADPSSMAYDWAIDRVVKQYAMRRWGDFTKVAETEATSTFSITSPDGITTFSFTIARADTGEIASANKMKIDFDLNGFPWVADDTYVALICSVSSDQKVDVKFHDDDDVSDVAIARSRKAKNVTVRFEDSVDTVGYIPVGEYTWAETALAGDSRQRANAEAVSVVATSPNDADSNKIAYSFVGAAAQSAQDIYWDPEAGVGYVDGNSTNMNVGIVDDSDANNGAGEGDGNREGTGDGTTASGTSSSLHALVATASLLVACALAAM